MLQTYTALLERDEINIYLYLSYFNRFYKSNLRLLNNFIITKTLIIKFLLIDFTNKYNIISIINNIMK